MGTNLFSARGNVAGGALEIKNSKQQPALQAYFHLANIQTLNLYINVSCQHSIVQD